jgi:pimeloyl-ACP methyl ester carboxylesterase
LVAALLAGCVGAAEMRTVCDADSDCYYLPAGPAEGSLPALVVLSCTGIAGSDLDSLTGVADSLGWILAGCHGSRNHRSGAVNDQDILATYAKLLRDFPVDGEHVYICGFSGMGSQALYELLRHPELFRGAVSTCAPSPGTADASSDALAGHAAYLVSREKDWNLERNRQIHGWFQAIGLTAKLVVTPGEHAPGGPDELLLGCQWLQDNTW